MPAWYISYLWLTYFVIDACASQCTWLLSLFFFLDGILINNAVLQSLIDLFSFFFFFPLYSKGIAFSHSPPSSFLETSCLFSVPFLGFMFAHFFLLFGLGICQITLYPYVSDISLSLITMLSHVARFYSLYG